MRKLLIAGILTHVYEEAINGDHSHDDYHEEPKSFVNSLWLIWLLQMMKHPITIRTALVNSMESDLGCTTRVYFDIVMLTSNNMTLTPQKPC